MHPFGGIPICPSCKKAVYAAEQVMGPGRKLYHKPCLACTACRKRLDSFTLVEHDEQPYCKSCHLKNFGTRDLRHANLPNAPPPSDSDSSPSSSSPTRRSFSPGPVPRLRPTRSLATSPISPTFRSSPPFSFPRPTNGSTTDIPTPEDDNVITEEETEVQGMLETSPTDDAPTEMDTDVSTSYPSNTGRPGLGTIPRTIPLNLNIGTPGGGYKHHSSQSLGSINSPLVRSNSTAAAAATLLEREGVTLSPLKRTATGTRYGAALGAPVGGIGVQLTGTPRKWGAGTPVCPRCTKSVYFAEQVKAVGKTWHKGCLRCTECGTSLDSSKLRDHDGAPFCVRCYSKLHGPQGSGYALLGKAGG